MTCKRGTCQLIRSCSTYYAVHVDLLKTCSEGHQTGRKGKHCMFYNYNEKQFGMLHCRMIQDVDLFVSPVFLAISSTHITHVPGIQHRYCSLA